MNHPFTCLVVGPTKAGKTRFVKNLIQCRERMIDESIQQIWWFYMEDQPVYEDLKHIVTFVHGPPDLTVLKSFPDIKKLVILDDMMQISKANKDIITLFSRGCHHWNISLVHIVQNAFYEGLRTSRINSDYLVLFKNPADNLQIRILSRQLFPGKIQYFLDAFGDATQKPHGYLLVDLTQYTPDVYRLKTDIFSKTPVIYIPT